MLRSVNLTELRNLSSDERKERLVHVAEGGAEVPNGGVTQIRERVARYESDHGMTTAVLRDKLRTGELRETSEISQWLFYAEMLDELELPR